LWGRKPPEKTLCRWVSTLYSIPCALLAMTGPIVESHLVAVGLNDQLGDGHDLKRNNLFLVNLRSLFEKIPILFLVNYLYP